MKGPPVRSDVREASSLAQPKTLAALEASAARVAASGLGILLVGENGVGKERFAEGLHARSRAQGSFVRLNCRTIDEAHLEAELDRASRALGEQASGGTVFLKHLPDLGERLQTALVRALEESSAIRFVHLAADGRAPRFISASTRSLAADVHAGRFRDDLYYRLCGATFTIPSLRERKDEIVPLAEHFIATAAHRYGRSASLSASARAYLTAHAWPGNLRELRNACERAVLLAPSSVIERDDLDHVDAPAPSNIRRELTHTSEPLRDTLAAIERERILEALDGCGGNQKRAAAMLGISRRTLGKRLDEYGFARPRKARW